MLFTKIYNQGLYEWRQALTTVNHVMDLSVPHHMKVEVEGSTFRCYLDDMEKPLITYTDTRPFITGRAGFRAHDSRIRFDNFVVTPKAKPDGVRPPLTPGASASAAPLQLYDLQGQQLSASAPTPRGIYIVREDGRSRKVMR